jgi:CRISPR-associated protein (TIGR03986 family)
MKNGSVTLTLSKKGAVLLEFVNENSKVLHLKAADSEQIQKLKTLIDTGSAKIDVEYSGTSSSDLLIKDLKTSEVLFGKQFQANKPPQHHQKRSFYDSNRSQQHTEGTKSGPRGDRSRQKKTYTAGVACAPYNFIPLPKEPKFADEEQVRTDQSRYHPNRLTGWIEYEIENLTDFYIRDTLPLEQNKADYSSDFFSPGGCLQIPGSSLRGMVRSVFEILTMGKFQSFTDRRLFYRSIFKKYSFNREYTERFAEALKDDEGKNKVKYQATGAWLTRDEKQRKWRLWKPQSVLDKNQKPIINDWIRVKANNSLNRVGNISVQEFTHVEISFNPEGIRSGLSFVHSSIIESESVYSRSARTNNVTRGVLLRTGSMNKKRYHAILAERSDQEYNCKLDLFEEYATDETRGDGTNLFQKWEDTKKPVPCFVLLGDEGQVEALGHTPMFRFPYKHKIGEFVPEKFKDLNREDWAEAIFGTDLHTLVKGSSIEETQHSGRVCFGSAFHVDGKHSLSAMQPEVSPKNLSGPKPHSFQHYLEQGDDLQEDHRNSYESNPQKCHIRGYKRYWHNKNSNWSEGKIIDDSQHTIVKPVKPHQKFKGKVWFENLTRAELGGLLLSLEPGENLNHKLGMGKPLGLGSIKLSIQNLCLQNGDERRSYYSGDFIDGWVDKAYSTEASNKIADDCVAEFASKIYDVNLKSTSADKASFWVQAGERYPHIREMKTMLEKWQHKDSVRYMEIEHFDQNGRKRNEYVDRPILPPPSEIKDNKH